MRNDAKKYIKLKNAPYLVPIGDAHNSFLSEGGLEEIRGSSRESKKREI